MSNRIYLPDTNVLYNYIESFSDKKLEFRNENAIEFFKRYGYQTSIPSLVLAEFCGTWFHKNIDLENYEYWFQKRLSMFNQMYLNLKRLGVVTCEDSYLSYQNIMRLSQDITSRRMSPKIIKKITGRIKRTIEHPLAKPEIIERNKRNLACGKLLDGLDSMIVSYAYEYAKKSDVGKVFIVSFDRFMIEIVNGFNSDPVLLNSFNLSNKVFGLTPYYR